MAVRSTAGARAVDVARVTGDIASAVGSVVEGKPEVVRLALVVLLAEGHLLVEDVPGVGKTLLARALARAIDCSVRRIQCTSDLLPGDITGVAAYNQSTREFEFKPGPVFANIVVADELNRASPKTQSALLECMGERTVSVDGVTYPLEPPFLVLATQNPLEMEGTYALPEAQRDRFTAWVSMGYPTHDAELEMLDVHGGADPVEALQPVATAADVVALVATTRAVHVSDEVKRYAVDLVTATREAPELRLGASPRATLQLVRAGRAAAALDGRDYVSPDDLQQLAVPVLAHRLLLSAEGALGGADPVDVLEDLLVRVPVGGARGRRVRGA